MVEVDLYVIQRLREGKKVNIEIIGKETNGGYLEMDWVIDKKLILKDFPFEVFEGEDGAEFINFANLEVEDGRD